MSRLVRRAVVCTVMLLVAATFAVPAGAASSEPATREQHCVANVVGQLDSGELELSSLRCYQSLVQAKASGSSFTAAGPSGSSEASAFSTLDGDVWLATHYDGFTFTGSSFSVFGPSCTGWLNMTAAWNNKISSTESVCSVWHYDGFNRTGATEMLNAPGGDLTALNNRTGSTQYTT